METPRSTWTTSPSGGTKGTGSLTFGTGGSTLIIDGRNNAAANLFIGGNDISTSFNSVGTVDLTGGTVTADLNELVIGRHGQGSGQADGTLTFEAGTITANTITLGDPNATGVSTMPGNTSGTINQNGGTMEFIILRKGDAAGVADYNFSAGTIRNIAGSDLTNVDVPVDLVGAGPRVIDVESGQTATFQMDAPLTSAGGFEKTGGGLLVIESDGTYAGTTLISAGELQLDGDHNGGAGVGAYTVADMATLSGDGGTNAAVNVADGGDVHPGGRGTRAVRDGRTHGRRDLRGGDPRRGWPGTAARARPGGGHRGGQPHRRHLGARREPPRRLHPGQWRPSSSSSATMAPIW